MAKRPNDVAYHPRDIAAAIASGSFLAEGMGIALCSMKTLAAVAHAHADELVARTVGRVLDLFGIRSGKLERWQGLDG